MQPGELIAGRFLVEAQAGIGGMGAVFRARDLITDEPVALKVLRSDVGEADARFLREAEVLARLHHPGIVRHIDHGRLPTGALYLAMEWLDGEDLAARLARGGLSPEQGIAVVARAAEALAVAHGNGVIHRDVKPSNLFLVGGGVKVLDFGIARLGFASSSTRTGVVMGTPGYMAPEQARGLRNIDARADVFSLGCVLFECVTGRPPFVGEHGLALLVKILLEEAPSPSEVRPGLPPQLDALVASMLAKDPAARPPDGAAVAAALASLDGARAVAAPLAAGVAPESLTGEEERLLCVVLVGAPDGGHRDGGTRAGLGPTPGDTLVEAPLFPSTPANEPTSPHLALTGEALLARAADTVRSLGARFEALAGGAMVASLVGVGEATDQAARAAACALALRRLLPEAPMAVATGRGRVGGRTPVGEVVERAASLVALATASPTADEGPSAGVSATSPLPVRLDEATAGLLDARFLVGGDAHGLDLRGLRAHGTLGGVRQLLGRPTPCVGRDREITNPEALFRECLEESSPRAALVTAPPGGGKSRLARELTLRLAATEPAPLLVVTNGDPLTADSPYSLLARAISRVLGHDDGEPLAVRQQKLRARVLRNHGTSRAPDVGPFLGELLGVPWDDEPPAPLRAARRDPQLMADRLRGAVYECLLAECSSAPVVVILDDLQWADPPSVTMIDQALAMLDQVPLFLLALARPEVNSRFPKLWEGRRVEELRLGALGRRASELLVRDVLGDRATPALVGKLVARAGGNAFYLEELIRAVAEGRDDSMPASVLAMLQGRLESFEPEARRVLRAASVFGERFWRGGVRTLLGARISDADSFAPLDTPVRGTGRSRSPLDEWLAILDEREVIARCPSSRFAGDEEWTFRHALVRDAAYNMLTDDDRRRGHRLGARWLEAAGEGDPIVLAEHFERGDDLANAAERFRRAAELAFERNDLDGALDRARRGLACISRAAAGTVPDDTQGVLHLVTCEVLLWRGAFAAAQPAATEAVRLLPTGGAAWHQAAGQLALASARAGDHAALEGIGRALVGPLPAATDGRTRAARIAALLRTSLQLRLNGHDELAGVLIGRVGRIDDLISDEPSLAATRHLMEATQCRMHGDLVGYLRETEAAAACYEALGDLRNATVQRVDTAFVLVDLGRYEVAERTLRESLVVAERMGLERIKWMARGFLGYTLGVTGRYDEGLPLVEQSLVEVAALGDRRSECLAHLVLADYRLLAGDVTGAQAAVERAVAAGTAGPIRARSLALLAEVRLAQGSLVDAQDAATEAALLLDRHHIGIDGTRIRLAHARTLHANGDRAGALRAIADGRRALLERARCLPAGEWRDAYLNSVAANAEMLRLAHAWLGAPATEVA